MAPTLLILAAGIGSRYGGMKQIDSVGPAGEALIDYSIYDAIHAGFGRVVFVIRKNIDEVFRDFMEEKLSERVDMKFVYQELDMIPAGISWPPGRIKPWGTAHAVWVAENAINEPFAAINADDFYGRSSYMMMSEYLTKDSTANNTNFCMMGYRIKHTLSDYGSVSRAICNADGQNFLQSVVERKEIWKEEELIFFRDEQGKTMPLAGDELVSMNMWGFTPAIFKYLEDYFAEFIRANAANINAEYYIPTAVNDIVKSGEGSVKILTAHDQWFGITYREDKPLAIQNIRNLIEKGAYPDNLWK